MKLLDYPSHSIFNTVVKHFKFTLLNLKITYINNVVNIIFFTPIQESMEHKLGLVHIKFSGSQKSQEIVIIVLRMVCNIVVFDVLSELLQSSFLLFTHIAHESIFTHISNVFKSIKSHDDSVVKIKS